MIGGLDVPTSGKVLVDGKDLSALKDEQLTIFRRRKIGFIFQNYNLVPFSMFTRTSSYLWNWTVIRWTKNICRKLFVCWVWKIS